MENTIELLRRWHAGEEAALHELLVHYLPILRERARVLLFRHPEQLRRQDSSDLAQEAAERALRYGPRFLPASESQFLGLLTRFMRNSLLNRVRASDCQERPSPSVLDLRADSDSSLLPDRALEKEEQRAWVRMALELLPDDDRDLFRMRAVEEASWDSIGSALGIAAGTARMRFERTRPRVANLVRRIQAGQIDDILDTLQPEH